MRLDVVFFWFPTSLNMSFDVVNLKRLKWTRSGSYGPGPEGSLGTVKSLDTTKEVWNLNPNTRRVVLSIVHTLILI